MYNPFKLHILGSSAAIPTSTRFTTAQLVNYRNKNILIDCAEGTQIQLRRLKLPMLKIDHIFISHLHGDHYLGLPGLIFTMHLLGRKKRLHIYAPYGIREIIEMQYSISELRPGFTIQYHLITKGKQLLFDDPYISITSIEMMHSLPTFGILIREKPALRNIIKEAIDKYQIPINAMQSIKDGNDLVLKNGETIPNHQLTTPPLPPRSYAYCADTGYTEQHIAQISNVDLLYHEATFLHDKADIAKEKTHCTALQAAMIAQKASAKQLVIGHYSARYDDLDLFTNEARTVFENTIIAVEGLTIEINLENKIIPASEKETQ